MALRKIHTVFYVNLLRELRDNGLGQQLPPIKLDSEQDFRVKAIVGHQVFRGQSQYMVWYNYNYT